MKTSVHKSWNKRIVDAKKLEMLASGWKILKEPFQNWIGRWILKMKQ